MSEKKKIEINLNLDPDRGLGETFRVSEERFDELLAKLGEQGERNQSAAKAIDNCTTFCETIEEFALCVYIITDTHTMNRIQRDFNIFPRTAKSDLGGS